MNAPTVEVQGLTKTYATSTRTVPVLTDVSFSAAPGEFLSVVGPSGCGKSTLLRILAGLLSYEEGTVKIHGEAVAGTPRRDVGVVFQQPGLMPWKSLLENAALPLLLQHRKDAYRRAEQLLELVGLRGFERALPKELSGGMEQRGAIVRALVTDPLVLLLDEPFGALDALTRENLNVELNRIWRETSKTIVLITHSIQEAVFLSSKIIVMSPRPARVVQQHAIPWGAERTIDLMATPEFGQHEDHVRRLLHLDGAET